MVNGEWLMGNGKWEMGNGEWEMGNEIGIVDWKLEIGIRLS